MNSVASERTEELTKAGEAHFWPHVHVAGDLSSDSGIKLVDRAEGPWVYDMAGDRWFDTLASLWCTNVGHGRTEIAEAAADQLKRMAFSPEGTVAASTVELTSKLASMAPDPGSRVFLSSGGSEAVETAIKMAKNYQRNIGEPSRWKVISRRGSYHGATLAAMSLGGGGLTVPHKFGPLMPGNVRVAQVDGYRGVFGSGAEAARDVERAIVHEGPSTVAAVIAEPISASAGIHVPDDDYWPTLREICDKYGVVLICDEVLTGFGRTGKMFAIEHWGVTPDILTGAKGLTSGYSPIGATLATKKIADAFLPTDEEGFMHLFTFGGNPASSAIALANLAIIENEDLVANSAEMGRYLYDQISTLHDRYEVVGDVRGGLGLFAAIEFVKDRETKEKFDDDAGLGDLIRRQYSEHRLLGRGADVIFIAPPLTLTKNDVDFLVEHLEGIVAAVQDELG